MCWPHCYKLLAYDWPSYKRAPCDWQHCLAHTHLVCTSMLLAQLVLGYDDLEPMTRAACAGDIIEIEIERVGVLRNTVVVHWD